MDYRGVVLLDSGSNVQVMSPHREDFENLKQVEGLKVNGLGSAVIEGAGAFLGVLEGSYCPEAKTQTAILAETMLDVLITKYRRQWWMGYGTRILATLPNQN